MENIIIPKLSLLPLHIWGTVNVPSVPMFRVITVKNLKIGTPEIITITVLQLEQLDFTVQYCVQKMQTE